jgi:hypothetical protein
MKISISNVRIKKIESPTTPMKFDELELKKAAQLILDMEGVVTPLILQRTAPEQEAYTIIDGYFQYYAALKAMSIDSRKGKTINAYVFDSKDEVSFYQQQIALFRQQQSVPTPEPVPIPEPTPIAKVSSNTSNAETTNEVHFAALEKTVNKLVAKNEVLEKTIPQLGKANENALHNAVEIIKGLIGNIEIKIKQEVGEQIKGLSSQIEALQSASVKIPREKGQPNKGPKAPTQDFLKVIENRATQAQQFLEAVNTLFPQELERKLKNVKASKRVIENLMVEKNKPSFQPFETIFDLLTPRISHLTERAMIKILDNWS